jgi:hypothetical protein
MKLTGGSELNFVEAWKGSSSLNYLTCFLIEIFFYIEETGSLFFFLIVLGD